MADDTTSGWGDALSTILKLYGAYQSSKPGKFTQVPQSPEEIALRQKMLGFIEPGGSPTRTGLASILDQYSKGARVGGQFRLPTSQGYTPGQPSTVAPYDPNQRYGANLDFSKLLGQYGASAAPTTQKPTSLPGPNISGPNGPSSGVFAPVGSPGDPFAAQNNTDANPNAHNVTWDDIKKYGPNAMKLAGGILTANPTMTLGAVLGIVQKMMGHDPNTLPTYPQTGQPNVTPGGFAGMPPTQGAPREQVNTYQGPGYQSFWNQQNANLMNGPGGASSGGNVWGKYAP